MITRKQYIANENTHDEYYSQFVNSNVIDAVNLCIGKDKIIDSKDEHFNDIPLKHWDNMPWMLQRQSGL